MCVDGGEDVAVVGAEVDGVVREGLLLPPDELPPWKVDDVLKTSLNISASSSGEGGLRVATGGAEVTISLGILIIVWTEDGSPSAMMSSGKPGLRIYTITMNIIS